MNDVDKNVLAELKKFSGSTAWAMTGALNMSRKDISASLQRLRKKGLVYNDTMQRAFWMARR